MALAPAREYLEKTSKKYPRFLVMVPKSEWPKGYAEQKLPPTEIRRSRDFLVQIYPAPGASCRMSACRAKIRDDGNWEDGITWDELQKLKDQAGFGDSWAVEIYPPDQSVVNVANMRHLWILSEPPKFAWRKNEGR